MSGNSTNEINVTPLIDILLVLLVVFLVAMPIMMRMITVALPPKADPGTISETVPIVLKLNADLSIAIEDGPTVMQGDLPRELRARAKPDQAVFVDFHASLPWSSVVSLLDTIKGTLSDAQLAVRLHDTPLEP